MIYRAVIKSPFSELIL